MSTTHYEITINSDESNRVLGKATGQVEMLTHYIDRNVATELVTLRRRVRKLERKLRKAAGRERRLVNHLFGHSHSQFVYASAKIRDARIEGKRYMHRNEICLTCYRPIRECGGAK